MNHPFKHKMTLKAFISSILNSIQPENSRYIFIPVTPSAGSNLANPRA